MKVRPDGTTFAAKESLPIRESNSRLVHFLVFRQDANRAIIDLSLSTGNRICMARESMVIPRSVIVVVGATYFSGENGMHRFSNTFVAMLIEFKQFDVLAEPAKR